MTAASPAKGGSAGRSGLDAIAVATMVLLTFSWGLNQVAVKVSNVGYNPILIVLVRSAVGGILVYLWCRWRAIPLLQRDGTLLPGIAAGVLFGLEFMLIYVGLDYTSAARGALMLNTMPFFVLVGGHFLLGERVTPAKFFGLVLAFAGVVLIFSDNLSVPGPMAIRGDLLCLGAGALWAATVLVIKGTRLAQASAEKTLLYQLLVSVLFVAPLVPFSGPLLREPNWLATWSVVYQAVFVVAFTYVLWFWLMRSYPASSLSSFTFLTPAFGVLLSGLLLNEPLSLLIFVALALIAAGLYLVNRPARAVPPG